MKSLKEKQEKGFTLIELLLVISIVSLLSTFTFFNFTEAKKKGEDAHMQSEASEVRKAIELYKLDNDGRVPNPGLKGQMVREGAADGYYAAAMEKLVDGGYLKEVPTSPSGESYVYLATEDETEAVFAASLNYETTSSGSSNSCSFITSGSVPESCSIKSTSSKDGYGVTSHSGWCSYYESNLADENEICVPFETTNFCTQYNQEGDFPNICDCKGTPASGEICDEYGGLITVKETKGKGSSKSPTYSGVVCELQESSVCDGSSNTDYCQCI